MPNRHIFPADMKGVTFIDCNLDNVYIDETKNTIKNGCHQQTKVQNDLSDWVLDKDLKPVEPMDREERIKLSISIDPKAIPLTKATKNVFEIKKELDEKTIK